MATLFVNEFELRDWVSNAYKTDVEYHRERRRIWEALKNIAFSEREANQRRDRLRADRHIEQEIPIIKIDNSDWIAIKTFCNTKNDRVNDDQRLAFETSIARISSVL